MTAISDARRRKILRAIPPRKCAGRRSADGEPCDNWAVVGATVCRKHGAGAPQVIAAAERRVLLAEAIASAPRRHPFEVMADALHSADVVAQQTQSALSQQTLTAELIEAMLDSIRTQAGMAKLALDAGIDPAQWTATEVNRRFGDTVAEICREMARQLGHDPASDQTATAFEAALQRVVYGRRRGGRKAIGGGSK